MAQEKSAVARPYAEAVLAYAHETNNFNAWSNMLNLLSTMVQTQEVINLISNPKFSRNQIEAMLLEVVREHFDIPGKNLLKTLFRNRRIFLAPEIAAMYEQLKRKFQKTLQAQITSAYPLDTNQIEQIRAALQTRFQQNIEVNVEQNPELIGGALIRIGSTIIDGSIRGQLQRLANQLRF
jgi:F-type H+-transporting ATPase subunit delta